MIEIENSTVYIKKLKNGHLPMLYYLEEENT